MRRVTRLRGHRPNESLCPGFNTFDTVGLKKYTVLTHSPARQHIAIAAPRLHGSGLDGLTCCDRLSTSRPFLHSPAELQARMVAATANPAGRMPSTYISASSVIACCQLPACEYRNKLNQTLWRENKSVKYDVEGKVNHAQHVMRYSFETVRKMNNCRAPSREWYARLGAHSACKPSWWRNANHEKSYSTVSVRY